MPPSRPNSPAAPRPTPNCFARLRNLTAQYLDDERMLDEPERTRRRREVRDLEQEAERKQIAYRDALAAP